MQSSVTHVPYFVNYQIIKGKKYENNSFYNDSMDCSFTDINTGNCLCWANEGETQPVKFKHLGIAINCGLASFREDLVVPLGFDGIGISLAIISSRQTEKNSFNTRVQFGLGYMQNRYDHEALVVVQEIRLSWVKKFTVTERYG